MRKAIVRVLVGFACLPTATTLNALEPTKSSAYDPKQWAYILESTDAADLKGGPARVVLTTFEPLVWGEDVLEVGDPILTKHSSGKKNLPSRRIIGVRSPEGTVFGEVPPGSLPHWELITEEVTHTAVEERINRNVIARYNARAEKKSPAQLALPAVSK